MDQRSALRILLAQSVLSRGTQDDIAATIDTMPDEEVVKLGTALAEAKKQQITEATKLAAILDETLKEIE